MPPRRAEADGLSALERRIYSTVHAAPEHTLTGDDLATRMGDVPIEEQLLAINSLLKKSLFNAQKGPSGIQYVAISRDEASLLGSMDANELIIYNHIKEAKNDGIWTKVIKARTNLHQTIMTRCLKLLEQKQLVKAVKSVKFPTRKIYMLYDLVPSIELSGGPWYTDNELDTGFIHELSMACLRYIQSKTWPKDGRSSSLYPASHTVQLPTAANVHQYLRSAKLTDTELEPEHVVALLDLLIYNNEVEKIPALPSAPSAPRRPLGASDDESSNDSEPISHPAADRHSRRKRRRVSIVASSDESNSEDERGPQRAWPVDDGSDSSGGEQPTRTRRTQTGTQDGELRNLTHVPYVYRAVKSMLSPPGSAVPPDAVPLNLGWFQASAQLEPLDEPAP